MADLPLQRGEGFEFQVEHNLQSESQQLALQELERLLASERNWPGCLGTVGPDLIDANAPNRFITRTHWRDVDCFVEWMVSSERNQLLKAIEELGYSYSAATNWRGYASWIAGEAESDPPPTWKVNLLVLLCLYPTVLILNSLINPLGMGYSSSLLLGNICSVALTGWLLVPAAQRWYTRWLNGRSSRRGSQKALLSIAALLLLSWAISRGISG
ncbi:hypothetical protein [Synechococcus sp. MIT S1220]|uniref:hypothetical protein n=1 Tax=Synechococcus sp. MIT S1220 TaxID=3082549 RepID=UPI0039AFD941